MQSGAINLMGHYLCACAQGPFRGEVGMSLLHKNLHLIGMPSGITEKSMIICKFFLLTECIFLSTAVVTVIYIFF